MSTQGSSGSKIDLITKVITLMTAVLTLAILVYSNTPESEVKTGSPTAMSVTNLPGEETVEVPENKETDNRPTGGRVSTAPPEKGAPAGLSTTSGGPIVKVEAIDVPPEQNQTPNVTTYKEEESIAPFYNDSFSGNIAFVNEKGTTDITAELVSYANAEGYLATSDYFYNSFLSSSFNSLWREGLSKEYVSLLPESLKCICVMKEEVEFGAKEVNGDSFDAVVAKIEFKLFNLRTRGLSSFSIKLEGIGAGEDRALESLKSRMGPTLKANKFLNRINRCQD